MHICIYSCCFELERRTVRKAFLYKRKNAFFKMQQQQQQQKKSIKKLKK